MDVLQAIVKLIADTSSLQNDINKRNYTAKVNADTSQAQKSISDLARLSQQKTMQTWANNNSKAMKVWGGQVNDIIGKMGNLGQKMSKADYNKLVGTFKSIQNEAIRTGNVGKSFGDKMKTAWEKFGGWSLATRSLMLAWRELRKGIDLVIEMDSALTNINYTMDVTKTQLSNIGNSSVEMAKDLKTSTKNVLEAVTLYANAKETADSILKKSEAAIMISNVTGMGGGQSAKMLQSVMNQFDLTQDDLMYISDTIQSVSQNMAYDFSAGIQEIAGGIERSGSVAKAAGLDLAEYASMLGLVIEKTGLSGETIGTAYRTILTRITKASAVEGTSEEDISKAEESLRAVGVQVRKSAGEFRDMTDIMRDLGQVWNDLDDVQQSNIGYQIAGTRQTNIIKTLLGYWTDYESLVEKAGDAAGTSLENQEKYAESYKGEVSELKATFESFWNSFLNSNTFKVGVNGLTGILTLLEKISKTFGTIGTIGIGVGIGALFKNFGRPKMFGLKLLF